MCAVRRQVVQPESAQLAHVTISSNHNSSLAVSHPAVPAATTKIGYKKFPNSAYIFIVFNYDCT